MTNKENRKFMAGVKAGLMPWKAANEVNPDWKDGHEALRQCRKHIGAEHFRAFMRNFVMPNRIANLVAREAAYVTTEEERERLLKRVREELEKNA